MNDDIELIWTNFIRDIRSVLSGLPEYRYQDQFLAVKEEALALAESKKIVGSIAGTMTNVDIENRRYFSIVFDEMSAFSLAVSVHQAEIKAGVSKRGANNALRKSATTILGSFNNVFEWSDTIKGVVTIVKETIELFGSE